MSLTFQIRRLARHSAIYGLGGILSRILAVLLLPLYTSYLGTRGFGKIELVTTLTTVLVIVLSAGISSAFFRFYFDSKDEARRTLVVRTSFWFVMGMATVGLLALVVFASPVAHALKLGDDPWLVRAAALRLWAQMNYQQLTNLFRVEERSVQFVIASIANILVTVGATVLLVVGLHKGATGAVVGNFVGTLAVYLVLLVYRRYQLGLQFDKRLLREMNRFGLPLVPSALALWAISFIDRLFVGAFKGVAEVGVYSLAVRVSSVIVFLMIAFRLAWPAFAYSIDDESAARRTYSYVLTYLLFVCCWISIGLGTLAPWLVQILAPSKPAFYRADEAVGGLAFGTTAYAGYRGLPGARDRHRPRPPDAVQRDRDRRRRRTEHRAQLRPHPAVRDDGRRRLDCGCVRRALPRHDDQRAARVPGALPVAARVDAQRRFCRSDGDRLRGALAATRDRTLRRLSAPAASARLLPAGGTCAPAAARAAAFLGGVRAAADVAEAEADGACGDEQDRDSAQHD